MREVTRIESILKEGLTESTGKLDMKCENNRTEDDTTCLIFSVNLASPQGSLHCSSCSVAKFTRAQSTFENRNFN